MGQPRQTKDFTKLQKVWYKRLKQAGFTDIEYDADTLINYSSSKLAMRLNGASRDTKIKLDALTEEYYRMAGHFIYDHTFKNEIELDIWTLHAEGLSFRDIAKRVTTKHYRANKDKINIIIKELAALMFKRYRNQNE